MLPHPSSCEGCVLDKSGLGYVPADGPANASLLFVGESAGFTEAQTGKPFVGDAGGMLQRLLTLLGLKREEIRIDNCVRCRPPGDWLEGAPWNYSAIKHCAPYLEDSLSQPGLKVVVPMGATAIKRILQVSGKKVGPENFHGTVNLDPYGRFLVVPTYHPSHLQRGAQNLIGTVLWDLQQAQKAVLHGKPEDAASLVIDPPIEWFRAWIDAFLAVARADPDSYPLTVDVETPDKAHGKDEGEITAEDRSYIITRVNLACHIDEGITVPFVAPYTDELLRLFSACLYPLWMFNKEYDIPRLTAAGVLPSPTADKRTLDLMWLWHYLQSDLPRGLGFVAPFYSTYGAWKHLSDKEPAKYGAIDGVQNHRVGFGVLSDLARLGMLEQALRHIHQLHHQILKPAQKIGVKIDRERLLIFKADLTRKAADRLEKLQEIYPTALRLLTPKGGLTKKPAENVLHVKASAFTRKGEKRKGKEQSEIKYDLYKKAIVVERKITRDVLVCRRCGALEVQRRHRCQSIQDTASSTETSVHAGESIELESRTVVRFFWSEPFNPDSWQQVLAYIKFRKHQPGKAKKTHKDSTDRETLERLQKTGDPLYKQLLDYRAIVKVKGTYVEGTERRLDSDDRIHPEPTYKPSTHRLSYVNPNITNVVQDRGGKESLAAGFRRCVVASPGCRLLEADYAGSEAVDVGWLCHDPGYIRLARLGVHAGLASHILKRPYDPAWSDADLGQYFKEIKKSHDETIQAIYNRSKRYVHGKSYGLTIPGMVLQFPETFPTRKVAEQYDEIFRQMAPAVPKWQQQTREIAFKQHYLGGPGAHPFGYKHWFWSVFMYKKITQTQYLRLIHAAKKRGVEEGDAPATILNNQYFKIALGEDGKRCVAFMPQSITAGKLKETMLLLFNPDSPSYIGDAYFGQTPLRAPIHDSLLLEIPHRQWDRVCEAVFSVMARPIVQMPIPESWGWGSHLATGISAKVGLDWGTMEDLETKNLGVGQDTIVTGAETDDEEDVSDLGREVA